MSTFDALVADLTRDVHRAQPKDALQFCANWFQNRLEEQRTRTRDALARRASAASRELSPELYLDNPLGASSINGVSPFSPPHRHSFPLHRPSIAPTTAPSRPFGTLNVPGNALLSDGPAGQSLTPPPPSLQIDPVSPIAGPFGSGGLHGGSGGGALLHAPSGDFLQPSATVLARRTSVSAESILVDSASSEPTPVFPKTPEQLTRIRASIAKNFIFRDLDEEQETGVLAAMQEVAVPASEVVIRQGDVGEYFYVVESGLLHCFIAPDALPPPAVAGAGGKDASGKDGGKFVAPGYHPEFGRKVAECAPGSSFGELALMYGHPRAATVLSIEPSTLWRVDRITFRTIILKAAHRRRTMYEHFLSTVPLLASLSAEERSKIADALTSKVYVDGDVVVRQGDIGDTFFFVEEGEAVVTKKQPTEDGSEVKVGHLRKGEYFGELSLLRRAPRAATVSAVQRTDSTAPKLKVAALDAAAFTRLLGPLREIMERNAGEAYGVSYDTYSRLGR